MQYFSFSHLPSVPFQLGLNCAVTAGSRVSQTCGADGRASVGSEVWLCRNELSAGIGTGKISVLSYSRDRCYHKKVNMFITLEVIFNVLEVKLLFLFRDRVRILSLLS